MPCGRDPERVHRVLLLRNERRGHGVEVPGRPGLEERRPARGAGVQRIEQNIPLRIEKRLRITPHLVVDHAPVASLADLLHEVRDQDGLAGPCRAGHDRVLGLGPLGVGNARDAVRCRRPGQSMQCSDLQRVHPPAQLPRAHQFRPAQAFFLFQPVALVPEPAEHEGDQAHADLPAEPRAGNDGFKDPVARGVPRTEGGDIGDRRHHRVPVLQPHFLPGVSVVADGELGFRERQHAGGVTIVGGCRAPEHEHRHGHDEDRDRHHSDGHQLAPHPKPVKNRLPAADGVAAPSFHDLLPDLSIDAVRYGPDLRGAGRRRRRAVSGARPVGLREVRPGRNRIARMPAKLEIRPP